MRNTIQESDLEPTHDPAPHVLDVPYPEVPGIDVHVPILWGETYLPSPRHRKPRLRLHTGVAVVRVPQVTGQDAPVAILNHTYATTSPLDGTVRPPLPYRWWRGRLLWPSRAYDSALAHNPAPAEESLTDPGPIGWSAGTLPDVLAAVARTYGQLVVVDGGLWEDTVEPVYSLDHGLHGVIIMIGGVPRNPQDAWPATGYTDMLAVARELAGPDRPVKVIGRRSEDLSDPASAPLEVLIGEAVTVTLPVRESRQVARARTEYQDAVHQLYMLTRGWHEVAYGNARVENVADAEAMAADEQEAWDRVARARATLSAVGHVSPGHAALRPVQTRIAPDGSRVQVAL